MPANLVKTWPQDWKRSVFIPIPKKGSAKECSNYCTVALISHVSKVMLNILQARLQQYMNHEFPDVQPGFRKGRGTRDQIANICWIIEKAREFQKNISVQFSSVAQSCLTLCNPMNRSTPGLPVHHQLLEFTQTHVHWVGDAIYRLILCRPLLLLPSIFPSIRVFSNESALHMRWPKYWSFTFNISPSNTQDCSPLGWTAWISLQSKELSRVFSNTTVQKHQFFGSQLS